MPPARAPAAERSPADGGGDQGQERVDVEGLRETRVGVQRLGLAGEMAAAGYDDHRDAPARGSYAGAPSRRDNVIELGTCGASATAVTLDGAPLARRATEEELDAEPGWYTDSTGLTRIRSGRIDVRQPKRFVVYDSAP